MAFALALAAVTVQAQEPPVGQPPVIVTAGDAIVRRAPDVALVTLAVETRAKSPRDAQRQNADAMAAVQQRLAQARVPKEAIRTLGYTLEQEFDVVQGRRVPREFVVRNAVDVRADDLSRVGELVDAVVQGGATSIAGVRFDLRDRAAVEREALRLAVVDARSRAEAAAAGAGRALDKILRIDDTRERPIAPLRPMMGIARTAEGATTPVEPGEIEIRARVTLTVSMK